jgi:peptidoglycan/xylan/chitin deacetylase (PgdA/CDA1 family)
MRGQRLAAIASIVIFAVVGFAGWRLWLKTTDLLKPAIVMQHANAGRLVHPTLLDRIGALPGRPNAVALSDHTRLIALTFDDGPYPIATPLLLQTLRDLHVPATFFLIGRDAQQFPDLERAIAASGNEIANHTLTHPDLDTLSTSGVTAELRGGAAVLSRISPDPAEHRYFRPPHGRFTLATLRAAQAAGFDTVLWNDDPGDWRDVSSAALLAHVLAHATVPEVLLLHSGRVATVAMLPELVGRFRAAGFVFVTVGELMEHTSGHALNHPAKISLEMGT